MAQQITQALESFSDTALCQWLNKPGAASAVSVLAAGAIAVPDPVTTIAGLGLLATQLGCSFNNTDQPAPGQGGCWKRERETAIEYYDPSYSAGQGSWISPVIDEDFTEKPRRVLEIISLDGYKETSFQGKPHYQSKLTVRLYDQSIYSFVMFQDFDFKLDEFRLSEGGGECLDDPLPGPDPIGPITDISNELNCELTAELGAFINSGGNMLPVIKYSSAASTRANGGIIEGCNWYGDLIYIGGDGCDCPRVHPYPPDAPWPPRGPGLPDWLRDILGGLDQDLIDDANDELNKQEQPGTTYQMEAPCDYDGDGVPLVWQKVIPPAPGIEALGLRISAIQEQLAQHLAWKTPTCDSEQEPLQGDWRTVSFRSEKTSPYGNSRLRKRFRYRSLSGLGLGEVVTHWKDFSFESGSVVVGHVGSSWGHPQVWAASADEGKRVIRHAAGEAGLDPDQVGRWAIGSSSSSRLGVSDTMRVDVKGGYYWITARDGSDALPIVATVSDL